VSVINQYFHVNKSIKFDEKFIQFHKLHFAKMSDLWKDCMQRSHHNINVFLWNVCSIGLNYVITLISTISDNLVMVFYISYLLWRGGDTHVLNVLLKSSHSILLRNSFNRSLENIFSFSLNLFMQNNFSSYSSSLL
jgi:hypothetical protein